jgi:hypothetical protein
MRKIYQHSLTFSEGAQQERQAAADKVEAWILQHISLSQQGPYEICCWVDPPEDADPDLIFYTDAPLPEETMRSLLNGHQGSSELNRECSLKTYQHVLTYPEEAQGQRAAQLSRAMHWIQRNLSATAQGPYDYATHLIFYTDILLKENVISAILAACQPVTSQFNLTLPHTQTDQEKEKPL